MSFPADARFYCRCPSCDAPAGEPCLSAKGTPRPNHPARNSRWASRRRSPKGALLRDELTVPMFPVLPDGTQLAAMRVTTSPERFVFADGATLDWLRGRLVLADRDEHARARCSSCSTESVPAAPVRARDGRQEVT